ncbi:MAG: molybdopterin converting factor [Bacteroidetes bacterium B1(2017)]|nr:MAG: molybdopterin converting factor [Bacteroidetes bacterium B1(2017)]
MSEPKKKKNVFVEGAIGSEFIAKSIASHGSKTDIGAHSIFLGQVRADELNNSTVQAIEYTCYQEMAEPILHTIREDCFAKFDLSCMHIYHSLGIVNAGQVCLFVFTSSKHRTNAQEACSYLVERIKKEVPIWGKEILEDENEHWKINTNKTND